MILSDWIYIIGFVAFWVVLYKLTHRKKIKAYYSIIRTKYCKDCKPMMISQQTALRLHNMRVRNRQLRAAEKTKLSLMEEEIELLRLQIMELRSQLYD